MADSKPPQEVPEDATEGREAQDHEQACIDTGGTLNRKPRCARDFFRVEVWREVERDVGYARFFRLRVRMRVVRERRKLSVALGRFLRRPGTGDRK